MNTSRQKPTVLLLALFILTSLLLPRRLAAQDLSYQDVSARAAGLGGAFIGRADDTSALFYNPAGLAFLDGLRIKTNIVFGSRTTDAAWPDGSAPYRSDPFEILGAHAISWQPFRRVTLATGLFPTSRFDHLWNMGWSGRLVSTLSKFVVHSFRAAVAVEVVGWIDRIGRDQSGIPARLFGEQGELVGDYSIRRPGYTGSSRRNRGFREWI